MGWLSDTLNPFSHGGGLSPRGIDSKIMRAVAGIAPNSPGGRVLNAGANANEEAGRSRNLYGAAAVVAAYFGQWGAAAQLMSSGMQSVAAENQANAMMDANARQEAAQAAALERNKPKQGSRAPDYLQLRSANQAFGAQPSTLLTGPAGVSTGSQQLGRTTLLGG